MGIIESLSLMICALRLAGGYRTIIHNLYQDDDNNVGEGCYYSLILDQQKLTTNHPKEWDWQAITMLERLADVEQCSVSTLTSSPLRLALVWKIVIPLYWLRSVAIESVGSLSFNMQHSFDYSSIFADSRWWVFHIVSLPTLGCHALMARLTPPNCSKNKTATVKSTSPAR